MEVVIVRHGPAEDRDPSRWRDDTQRPLSAEGRRATRRAAEGLSSLKPTVDRVITSPAVRAFDTAEIFAEVLKVEPALERWEELEPDRPSGPILERLQRLSRRGGVLLVGHEPTLGELLGLCVTGDAVPITRFSKAGAARIAFPQEPRPGAAEIDWVLTRKQLERLG